MTGNPASDDFEVLGGPSLLKEFTDDPAQPGATVTLEFTLTHDESAPGDATAITFTDDLDVALSGLVAIELPAFDVCGAGSFIFGTQTLTLAGGSLAPGGTCSFSVSLDVPAAAAPGNHTNTTSNVMATVSGVAVESNPAEDDLQIAGVTLTKEFTDDPVLPGGQVTLRFTIDNISASDATGIEFTDDLDDTLNTLAATGLPLSNVCGAGSALNGTSFLTLTGGNLLVGESCTFDVTLDVPAAAEDGDYNNVTSAVAATFGSSDITFDPATDALAVRSDLLLITKEFTDAPVLPGSQVTLRFTIDNISASEATAIFFTDDLDASLAGLAVAAGGLPDTGAAGCGTGSSLTVAGGELLVFVGGVLAAATDCTFDVTLDVPAAAEDDAYPNTTSDIIGTIGGQEVTGDPATDDLLVDLDVVVFTKEFQGTADPGGIVDLEFTMQNLGAEAVTALSFSDDLDAVLSGLVATGLPVADVCVIGSVLDGTELLTLRGGNLFAGGSCTFTVTLQVPGSATPDSYVNTTSDLEQEIDGQRLTVSQPALDSDGDTVFDVDDVCADTVIPEAVVPTKGLGGNRHALVNDDTIFDTNEQGTIQDSEFTVQDTAGCSCEQIIAEAGLGQGQITSGCSTGAMQNWIKKVGGGSPVSPSFVLRDLRSPLRSRSGSASRRR